MDNNKKGDGPVSVGEEVKKLMSRLEKERAEGVGTPAPYRIMKMIETFMPGIRENVKQNKMLAPVAFVFTGEQWSPVIMDTSSEAAKDFTARALKQFCAENSADCIITVTESWTLSQEDAKQFMEDRKYGIGPRYISEHPRRKEVISFTVEMSDGSYYGGISEILPDREITKPEITKMSNMSGRFSGFLPKKVMN